VRFLKWQITTFFIIAASLLSLYFYSDNHLRVLKSEAAIVHNSSTALQAQRMSLPVALPERELKPKMTPPESNLSTPMKKITQKTAPHSAKQAKLKLSSDYYQIYNPKAEVDYILVNLDTQQLHAFSGQTLVLTEKISAASSNINIPSDYDLEGPHNHFGNFSVINKVVNGFSHQFNCPMPYALYYFKGHAIHQTEPQYYHLLGTPASHGCIREGPVVAKWLFDHTSVGTPIKIFSSNSNYQRELAY